MLRVELGRPQLFHCDALQERDRDEWVAVRLELDLAAGHERSITSASPAGARCHRSCSTAAGSRREIIGVEISSVPSGAMLCQRFATAANGSRTKSNVCGTTAQSNAAGRQRAFVREIGDDCRVVVARIDVDDVDGCHAEPYRLV